MDVEGQSDWKMQSERVGKDLLETGSKYRKFIRSQCQISKTYMGSYIVITPHIWP